LEKTRKKNGRIVDLSIRVEAGPQVDIVYRGRKPQADVRKSVESAWEKGFFDGQRIPEAIRMIRASLARKGYLQAEISSDVNLIAPGEKRVLFAVDEGVRFHEVSVVINGAADVGASRLKSVLEDEKLIRDIHVEPDKAVNFLEDYYRAHGYLDADIGSPGFELDPAARTAKILITVEEGPQYKIRKLEFKGNRALTDQEIIKQLPIAAGEYYLPESLKGASDQLEELYWTRGFNDAIIQYRLQRTPQKGQLDIAFQITEKKQQVIEKIEIEGNRETGDSLIRSQMELSPGDILDYRKTNASRRHLYNTGAYTLVDIHPEPIGSPHSIADDDEQQPVALKVAVEEVRPFDFRYSAFYDTERGPGGLAEFSNRNSLGSARLVGTRFRYDSDVQEVRGYFGQPILRRFPMDSDITGFFRREFIEGGESPGSGFTTDIIGVTLQQEVQFRNKFILNYGYRFQHNRIHGTGAGDAAGTTANTAPLTITLSREARNDILDASRGSFTSLAFEYAPSYLGSDIRFYKFLGQYFHYLPLSRKTEVPWVGAERSRLVFAGGVRMGLAGGLDGQDLIRSDKFFAGGGTTIRGFGQNEAGPRGLDGNPAGGNALFIANGELRFPIFSVFDGVGFLDAGNVYPEIGNFDPSNVRFSSGFGLRVRTPYFLIRADYGFKLDRKPGESSGKFFFSIGQAF